jgi:putative addiction module component (TIGR02574 family)
MNKIDEAWALLKSLPESEQEIAAEAILDFAAQNNDLQLGEEQLAELQRRLDDPDPKTVPWEEVRIRLWKRLS